MVLTLSESYLILGYTLGIRRIFKNNCLRLFFISWFSVYFPIYCLQVSYLGQQSPSVSGHYPLTLETSAMLVPFVVL